MNSRETTDESAGMRVKSDEYLLGCESVSEWSHQLAGGKVEDQSESDGNGQSWKRLAENCQQEQSQTQSLITK